MPKPEKRKSPPDPQRDKMDRPEPGIQPVEGDEETIEEDLKEKEQKKHHA